MNLKCRDACGSNTATPLPTIPCGNCPPEAPAAAGQTVAQSASQSNIVKEPVTAKK